MLYTLLYQMSSVVIPCVMLLWVLSPANAQDSEAQNPIYEFQIPTASAVAWSPDGEVLAIGDTSGIRLYTETMDFIGLLEQPTDEMKALTWSPDGQYLAAVGVKDDWKRNDIYIWRYTTREPITIFDHHEFMVPQLTWSPNSQRIASASWDQTVQIWNAMTGEIEHSLSVIDQHNAREFFSVTWSPDNRQIATITGVGIVVWDARTGKAIRTLPDRPFPPHYLVVSWSPDGRYLASNFNVLEAETGEEISSFENCPQSIFIDWHPDSQMIAMLQRDQLEICNAIDDEIMMTFDGGIGQDETEEVIWGYLNALDWHPDGKRLASAAFDGKVRIWQVFQ